MTKKYNSQEKGKKVCGMLEKQSKGRSKNLRANYFGSEQDLETFLDSKSVMEFDKSGDLYVKNFLFDRSISANLWGINYDRASESLPTVAGKPIVEYQNTGLEPVEYDDLGKIERVVGEMDHPPMDDANLQHTLELQEPYRVGTYDEVVEHPNDGSYWGIGRIHDEGVRRAFSEDPDLPFFTSSAIRSVGKHNVGTPVDKWIFLHSALVDRPAFGVRKAAVKAQCTGDSATCLSHLRRASVNLAAAKGIDMEKGCPFCTYGATKSIGQSIRNEGLQEIASSVVKHGSSSSSLVSSILNKKGSIIDNKVSENIQSVNSSTAPANPAAAVAAETKLEPQTLSIEARLMQEIKEKDELKAKLSKKDQEIESLQNDLKVATTYSSDLKKEFQSLKQEWDGAKAKDKRDQIAWVVKKSELYKNLSDEDKEKKVDLFASLVSDVGQVKEMLGDPESMVVAMQNGQAQSGQQQQQQPQQQMGMNAVASTHNYNDGTQYGGNKTASVRDNVTEQDGLTVFNSLRSSYFNRGSRSEI